MTFNNRYFTLVLFLSSSHLFVDGFGEYFKKKVTSGLSRLASPFKKTEKNIPIDNTWPDIMKDLTTPINSCSGEDCQKNLVSLQQLQSLVLRGEDEATMGFISTQLGKLRKVVGVVKNCFSGILRKKKKEKKNPVQSDSENEENEDKSMEVLAKARGQKEDPSYATGTKPVAQEFTAFKSKGLSGGLKPGFGNMGSKSASQPPAGTGSKTDPRKQVKVEPQSKRDGEYSSTDDKLAASESEEPVDGISEKLEALESKIPVNPNRERAAAPIKEFWDENWNECNSGELGQIIAATQSRNNEEK